MCFSFIFFFSSRRRHTRCSRDWSSDVCSSDLARPLAPLFPLQSNQTIKRLNRTDTCCCLPVVATLRLEFMIAMTGKKTGRRSEERRVGKESRYRWSPDNYKKKKTRDRRISTTI